jgi:hypothetical protein
MCKGWCSAAGVAAGAGAAVGVKAAHGKQKQVYSRRVRRKHKGQPKLKMQYRVRKISQCMTDAYIECDEKKIAASAISVSRTLPSGEKS